MEASSTWGGQYSRWGFDEGKGFLIVAKEKLGPAGQAVPLLDDELNCQAEILLTLLRRAVNRIHGDGSDNSGFKVAASATNMTNNFTITGGDGTINGAGYMLVQGFMPFLLSNMEYTGQSGVPALTTPAAGDRVDEVYLDICFDEISGAEDSTIIDSVIGFETSRRIKLVWQVRVAEGGTTPSSYLDGTGLRHWTAPLAKIARVNGDNQITAGMITDIRNWNRMPKRGEFVHTQGAAATSWTITHNLGTKNLDVTVWDSTDEEIEAHVAQTDENTLVVSFGSNSVAGRAVIRSITSFGS